MWERLRFASMAWKVLGGCAVQTEKLEYGETRRAQKDRGSLRNVRRRLLFCQSFHQDNLHLEETVRAAASLDRVFPVSILSERTRNFTITPLPALPEVHEDKGPSSNQVSTLRYCPGRFV